MRKIFIRNDSVGSPAAVRIAVTKTANGVESEPKYVGGGEHLELELSDVESVTVKETM